MQWGLGYSVQLLQSQKNLKPVVVLQKKTYDAVQSDSSWILHTDPLKRQVTFTPSDPTAPIPNLYSEAPWSPDFKNASLE